MKTNIAFELTELDRRTVRAALGRGGMATRKEFRIFADRAIRDALTAAPEPKVKRAKVAPPKPSASREMIDAAHEDAICGTCHRPKNEHGRMGFTCPPGSGRPKGTRFTIPSDVVDAFAKLGES